MLTRKSRSLPPINRGRKSRASSRSNVDQFETLDNVHFPSLTDSSKPKNNPSTNTTNCKYSALLEQDFLDVPEEFDNPQEALKIAVHGIKQNDWQSSTPAVINLMQISRFRPELLDSSMPLVNRSLCSLLKNTRTQIVRTACQVAMEFYKTIQYSQRPEFDELVGMLLLKSTHNNKGIRDDARRALESMVQHLPASVSVKVLSSELGAGHKNALIRSSVSSLICRIVDAIGADALMSGRNLNDVRNRIFQTTAKFLTDSNYETRNNAKKVLKTLMSHADFETLFYRSIDRKIADKIRAQLVALKYS